MEFRPCIDIHNGKVKQIVGSSLRDAGSFAIDNYVSDKGGKYYANLFKEYGLTGGHIILLNKEGQEYYEETKAVAFEAMSEYPGGLQIGGGVNDKNAASFIEAGASAVIVTSFVFDGGHINWERLELLKEAVGADKIVLDLSCKRVGDAYYIATNRWQTLSDEKLDIDLLNRLAPFCKEYLIHAVDVEGKAKGIEEDLVKSLADFSDRPLTYAGGVSSLDDIRKLGKLSNGKFNVTVGSALDIYGGALNFAEVAECCKKWC